MRLLTVLLDNPDADKDAPAAAWAKRTPTKTQKKTFFLSSKTFLNWTNFFSDKYHFVTNIWEFTGFAKKKKPSLKPQNCCFYWKFSFRFKANRASDQKPHFSLLLWQCRETQRKRAGCVDRGMLRKSLHLSQAHDDMKHLKKAIALTSCTTWHVHTGVHHAIQLHGHVDAVCAVGG